MPELIHRDPLRADFWDERFERQFMPWDRGGVPQDLRDFVNTASTPCTTLIPGCGHAYEAAFFLAAGWPVTAIDFSAAAVATARALLGPEGHCVQQADFFTYQSASPLQLIYERAFFCALPPSLRAAIVARWAALLAPGALLAGYFFITEHGSLKGPPFAIACTDWQALMAADFVLLEDKAVADSITVFAGQERWQVWQRRN